MPKYIAKRFYLEGRVQGVGCRGQIYDLVDGIGHISGFVRNLSNGSVEVVAKGPDWRMKDLECILREKMRMPVQVSRLLSEEISLEECPNGFSVYPDVS